MAIAATATFGLSAEKIIDAAYRRVRGDAELVTGKEARAARQALQLLMLKIQTRGARPWLIDEIVVPLAAGTAVYTLPADTVDVLDLAVRQDGADLTVERVSRDVYAGLPNKSTPGRPAQALVERRRDAPVVTLWPVPDQAGELCVGRLRCARDIPGLADGVDAPSRWQPAIISGLAFSLAMDRREIDPARLAVLKAQWEEDYGEAATDDGDGMAVRFEPDMTDYFG